MLFGFVVRRLAFEFRRHAQRKRWWTFSFEIGSLFATSVQRFALGSPLGEVDMENGRFAGSAWNWLHPYSMLIAPGVLSGYIMLGAHYLIQKTDADLQRRGFGWALAASVCILLISIGVHLTTAWRYPHVADKWSHISTLYYTAFSPAVAALLRHGFPQSSRKARGGDRVFFHRLVRRALSGHDSGRIRHARQGARGGGVPPNLALYVGRDGGVASGYGGLQFLCRVDI
jgi:cytochrome bd-type quinol oxidase subunit 2